MECVVFENVWKRFKVVSLEHLACPAHAGSLLEQSGCMCSTRVALFRIPLAHCSACVEILMVKINSPQNCYLRNGLPFFKEFSLFSFPFKRELSLEVVLLLLPSLNLCVSNVSVTQEQTTRVLGGMDMWPRQCEGVGQASLRKASI